MAISVARKTAATIFQVVFTRGIVRREEKMILILRRVGLI
jgi:hypothetical protein